MRHGINKPYFSIVFWGVIWMRHGIVKRSLNPGVLAFPSPLPLQAASPLGRSSLGITPPTASRIRTRPKAKSKTSFEASCGLRFFKRRGKPRDIGSNGISLGSIFIALLFVSLKLTWPHVSYLKAVMAKEDYWDVLLVLRISWIISPLYRYVGYTFF